jgi:hypothetical protein
MKPIDQVFADIAREHLGIETLAAHNRDSLDFHDVGVAAVKDSLRAAYEAGRRAAGAPPAEAVTGLPIVLLTVRGGCVEAAEATIPLRVVLEDWDCEDRLTGKKPYRAELPPTGGLSRKKLTQCLRHL